MVYIKFFFLSPWCFWDALNMNNRIDDRNSFIRKMIDK